MKDKLLINETGDGDYFIQWFCQDSTFGEDWGSIVGEFSAYTQKNLEKLRKNERLPNDDAESAIAENTLVELNIHRGPNGVFLFESKKEARGAIALIKTAIKHYMKTHQYRPAWEIKALEAGWTPPPIGAKITPMNNEILGHKGRQP